MQDHLLLRHQPRRLGAGLRPPDRVQAGVPEIPQEIHRLRYRQNQRQTHSVVEEEEEEKRGKKKVPSLFTYIRRNRVGFLRKKYYAHIFVFAGYFFRSNSVTPFAGPKSD